MALESLSLYFSKGRFVREFISLVSGNVVAQLLVLIATPIITRMYSPLEFGAMSFIASCIAIVALFACLRYDQVIILPKNKFDAFQIVILTFFISISIMSVVAFFMFILIEIIGLKTKYGGLLWLIPIGGLITCWNYILISWNIRNKCFDVIAFSQVLIVVVSISIKLFYGIIGKPYSVWLVIGNICGVLAGSILLLGFLRNELTTMKRNISMTEIFKQARKYKKFPLYGTMNSFLDSISQNLPIFLLGFLFSPAIVGYYGLGSMVLRKPIQTIGISVSKVFIQRAAIYNENKENIEPILKKATLGLSIMAIIPFGLLFIFGGKIFSIIFGAEWKTAGIYCQILAPWLFFVFIGKPSSQVIIVKQELKFGFYLTLFSILLRGTAIITGYYLFQSVIVCLILFSIIGVISISVNIKYAFILCKKY